MTKRLVNVRLDEQRLERARRLRDNGIALSDLVQDAIDRRYEQLVKSSKDRDVEAIMEAIYEVSHLSTPSQRSRLQRTLEALHALPVPVDDTPTYDSEFRTIWR